VKLYLICGTAVGLFLPALLLVANQISPSFWLEVVTLTFWPSSIFLLGANSLLALIVAVGLNVILYGSLSVVIFLARKRASVLIPVLVVAFGAWLAVVFRL
jgi:hypothetical protein